MRSPLLAFRWVRENTTIEFEGGAHLLLRASNSGIAASMVVEAVWPAEQGAEKAPPVFSDSAPKLALAPALTPESAPGSAITLGDANAQPLNAKRVELSGDISGHALLPEGHAGFIVDSMDDPTRMRFGYFQTSSLIRALRKSPSMAFRLTLRRPEVSLTTDAIPLDGLSEAVRSLELCQRGKK